MTLAIELDFGIHGKTRTKVASGSSVTIANRGSYVDVSASGWLAWLRRMRRPKSMTLRIYGSDVPTIVIKRAK